MHIEIRTDITVDRTRIFHHVGKANLQRELEATVRMCIDGVFQKYMGDEAPMCNDATAEFSEY